MVASPFVEAAQIAPDLLAPLLLGLAVTMSSPKQSRPLAPSSALLRGLHAVVPFVTLMMGIVALQTQPVAAELPPVTAVTRSYALPVAATPREPSQQRALALQSPFTVSFGGSATPTKGRANRGRAPMLEALLIWTEQLVRRLDPLDIFETPFARRDNVSLDSPNSIGHKARVRPVQMPNGGYGLVARFHF